MTRRISKSGRAYSEGSSSARGSYPPNCHRCGESVRSSAKEGPPIWYENAKGELRSWHWLCRVPGSVAYPCPVV